MANDPTVIDIVTPPPPPVLVITQTPPPPIIDVIKESGPPGPPGNPAVWVEMTQAAYDALPAPDPNTLYVIVG